MTNVAKTIAQAIAGDEAAQCRLYETYYAAAFRLAYLMLQNECDAEEVVQDTFVYLFRSLHHYDAERGSFWAWLRVALVSRCRNKRRRRQFALVSLERLEAAGRGLSDARKATNPAAVLEGQGVRQAIWEALQRVTPGARDALILRYYGGLSYAEIAEVLGCSRDAARSRVSHGKVQLRALLTAPDRDVVGEDLAWLANAR
ncbi:MAG TPA: sigma-70 family RNA polymerase sigma factor [Chloroflexi bacterium]|nr:sigma-70 family RNA polymerase sigma factor [Chloroflexota bacterium]